MKTTAKKTSRPLFKLCLAAVAVAGLAGTASAESVIFGGVEGSSAGSYGYLGGVTPFKGEQLGQGWYQKAVLSLNHYRYESTERGPTEEVNGRVPGIEAGIGRAWQKHQQTLDLSVTAGYRHVSLRPFEPADEKTGSVFTLNPQLMASTPLVHQLDADLIANYSIGLSSSFTRIRAGYQSDSGWRAGIEGKRLDGRNYLQQAAGVFVAIPLSDKLKMELNAGRLKPRDQESVSYAGVAFSVVF